MEGSDCSALNRCITQTKLLKYMIIKIHPVYQQIGGTVHTTTIPRGSGCLYQNEITSLDIIENTQEENGMTLVRQYSTM